MKDKFSRIYPEDVKHMLNHRTILITGGTGSFGRKCVATILSRYRPKKIIVFSRDEARNTLACDTHYVILPDNMFFNCRMDTNGFLPVPEGFEYRSDTNPDRVSKADVEKMISDFSGDEE